ncbi:TetR/AcrR family transcriptional regulator [Haloferula sp. BvORR071]|uniref:TetR/AcrR family transcriptional regulator n=1 Tax=Haloferula sp. BvORR071 TaxID=1396141 RepID=UPI0006985330|nr:TetR/AcrR family transcriptional regulator [Haloferula sp. BvORR071]
MATKAKPSPTPEKTGPKASAEERLVAAAAVVFARDGLSSATTREIAREAGVNEVTLFRKFGTKYQLLTAVLEKMYEPKASPQAERFGALPPDAPLREVITAFVEAEYEVMTRNIALVRSLIGEIRKFEEHELKVLRSIFKARREELIKRLLDMQARGGIVAEVEPVIVVDQLGGMIFTHALRCDGPLKLDYGRERYLKACIDLIVRAIGKEDLLA